MILKVHASGGDQELVVPVGARLLDHLKAADIFVNAACGGKGSCHKCRVQLTEGFLPITAVDKKAFRESELGAGWRLSCQSTPKTSCSILIPETENLSAKPRAVCHETLIQTFLISKETAHFACDLGSTGVVVAIVNQAGQVLCEAHALNRQIQFGADVMTRLQHAQENGVAPLQNLIQKTLLSCLDSLKSVQPAVFMRTKREVYCSGNSAMVSFLHNWDIHNLAVSPFQPSSCDEAASPVGDWSFRTMPLMGGFVGADTVAGLYYLEASLKPKAPWMFVDIGTNTEIVLDDGRGNWWFGSAPAGPAFEGGNIMKGMRAEPGAISQAHFKNQKWVLETIGGDRARGICGSGLIDILSEAVQGQLIEPDGFVEDGKLMITDGIDLLADDIREFQLAKSATRTATEILIKRAGVKPETIYLAGTFAQHLRLDSLKSVGLLPPGPTLQQIGNASLLGPALFVVASPSERASFLQKLRTQEKQIELALQDDFQDIFVSQLNFHLVERSRP